MSFLIKKIEELSGRLKHKAEAFSSRCDQLTETIMVSAEQKLNSIRKMESEVLQEVAMIKSQNKIIFEDINHRIDTLKEKIDLNVTSVNSTAKVK